MDAEKVYREKARREQQKNAMGFIEQIKEATPYETTAVTLLNSHI